MKNFSKSLLVSAALLMAGTQAFALSFEKANPASGSTLTEIKSVTLYYQGLQDGYYLESDDVNGYILYSFNGGEISSMPLSQLSPSVFGNMFTLTIPTAINAPGEYVFYMPVSCLYATDGNYNYDDPTKVGTIEDGDYAGTDYSAKVEYTIGQTKDPVTFALGAYDLEKIPAGATFLLPLDITNNTDKKLTGFKYELYRQNPYETKMYSWTDASGSCNIAAGESGVVELSNTMQRIPGSYKAEVRIKSVVFDFQDATMITFDKPIVLPFEFTVIDGAITTTPANGSNLGKLTKFTVHYPTTDSVAGLTWVSGKKPTVKRYPVGGGTSKSVTLTWAASNYQVDGFNVTITLPTEQTTDGLYYITVPSGFCTYGVGGKNKVGQAFLYFNVDAVTGITELGSEMADEAVFYDLQGRQVVNPAHGIYIKRIGNKAYKIAL